MIERERDGCIVNSFPANILSIAERVASG